MSIMLRQAREAGDIEQVRALFQEYQRELGVDLCFQGFAQELADLPGAYAPPRGRLYLAVEALAAIGCVGMRPLDATTAEMKRLYVRASHRGRHVGRRLAQQVIEDAQALGYEHLVLDTLPSMGAAQALYLDLGFRDIAPYTQNPVAGARFLARLLSSAPHETA